MTVWTRAFASAALAAAPFFAFSTAAQAGVGDLLVAPTRIVLDGRKGAEIVLNNIGDEPARYLVFEFHAPGVELRKAPRRRLRPRVKRLLRRAAGALGVRRASAR